MTKRSMNYDESLLDRMTKSFFSLSTAYILCFTLIGAMIYNYYNLKYQEQIATVQTVVFQDTYRYWDETRGRYVHVQPYWTIIMKLNNNEITKQSFYKEDQANKYQSGQKVMVRFVRTNLTKSIKFPEIVPF